MTEDQRYQVYLYAKKRSQEIQHLRGPKMTTRKIEVTLLYADSGETCFVLPSGFKDLVIVVRESPVDLIVKHETTDWLEKTTPYMES
jgi:hypothetical protein